MKQRLERLNQENGKQFVIFKEFFPNGEIERIKLTDIPVKAINYFERKSRQFTLSKKYKTGNFDAAYAVKHDNGDRTYIVVQRKTYDANNEEELIYFAEMREEKMIGSGELRYNDSNKSEYFKGKPFVGSIHTEKNFRKRGLGTRRIKLMHAMSRMQYSLPLYSDTLNTEELKNLWENLVKKGKAKKIKEGENDRYVIID